MNKCIIKWKKLADEAIIPTKRKEDAGFDIYTIETDVVLKPHEKHLFSTGLAYSISDGYWLMAADRGSTGSKGLHIHCGICDNGYRGEIFICICNDNDYPVLFTNNAGTNSNMATYPISKAIAQLIPMPLLEVDSSEITDDEWNLACANSERGSGALGSSGK